MIVVEGPDGAGKSTLITELAKHISWPVMSSHGPELYPGEIVGRASYYLSLSQRRILDRHPIISQRIYARVFDKSPILDWQIQAYNSRPYLTIYCRPSELRIERHNQIQLWDTDSYVDALEKNQEALLSLYDEVMKEVPHVVYDWTNLQQVIDLAMAHAREDDFRYVLNAGLIRRNSLTIPRSVARELGLSWSHSTALPDLLLHEPTTPSLVVQNDEDILRWRIGLESGRRYSQLEGVETLRAASTPLSVAARICAKAMEDLNGNV